MQAAAQVMRQWCGIAALVLSPTLAWAACPALPSAVVPYTVFGSAGAAAVTTQPTTTADATVQGAVAFDTAAGALKVCDGTSWQTLGTATPAGSSGYVQFSNGSAFAGDSGLFWDNTNKRLALGTTNSPASLLHLRSTSPRITLQSASGTSGLMQDSGSANSIMAVDIGALTFKTGVTWSGDWTATGTERMRISNGGNVGIGTTNPGSRLTIVHATDTWDGIAISETGVSGESFIIRHYGGPGSGTQLVQDGDMPIRFLTNNVERMRVDGSGRVGIATGTGVSPAATLEINGYMKLAKNTAAPVACGATYDGSIALTSARRMCVCDGTSWKEVNSATACTW